MPVHQLGQMRDVPRDRQFLVRLPQSLLSALEDHVVNRIHEGKLPAGATMDSECHAVIAIALRAHLDHWPDLNPVSEHVDQAAAYVRVEPCGCITAVIADDPTNGEHVAESLAEWLRQGCHINRLPADEAAASIVRCNHRQASAESA